MTSVCVPLLILRYKSETGYGKGNTMQQLYNSLPGKQGGATLVVALVMLLLLSLLGANSLRNAIYTERMAATGHQKNITFQASESAAVIATARNSQIIADAIRTNAPVAPRDVTIQSNHARAEVSAVPLGSGAILGSSLGVVGGLRVMITSTGELISDPRSQTVTVHGITRMGTGG